MIVRADAITPGMRIRRTRVSGAVETLTVTAVRRQHENKVTRYSFDVSPNRDVLGWFTPGAPVHVED